MIIFKTVLTDKQIEDYKRPEGTKNPECGGGMNCAFCTLKLLGVYARELEETSKTCGPRFRAGNMVKTEEYIDAIKQVIADMTEEHHEFVFVQEIGQPSVSLAVIAENLEPLEACYFIYGRSGGGTHAVVLRKNTKGEVELIDPQRGLDDIGKDFGFTAERASELAIQLTPEYYRVRGIQAIEAAMVEQSVLFKYWESEEELMADLPNFVVGCLMVDSVVGLKMLIDDRDTSRLMDVEDIVVRNPNPQMDVEAEMEGGARTGPAAAHWDAHRRTLIIERDTRLMADVIRKGFSMTAPTTDVTAEYTWPSEKDVVSDDMLHIYYVIAKALSPKNADKNGDILTRLFEMSYSEEDEKEEEEEYIQDESVGYLEDTGPFSGGAGKRKAPEPTKLPESAPQTKDFLVKSSFVFNEANKVQRIQRKGLNRFEDTDTTAQCNGVTSLTNRPPYNKNNCWLCLSPTNVFGGAGKKQWPNIKIGRRHFNRAECEHLIPAETMKYIGVLFSRTRTSYSHPDLMRELYDNSCNACNNKKDKHFYIKTSTIDGPYVPNELVILKDVISFFTFIGKGSSEIVYDGGLIKDKLPADIQQYGSIVEVGSKTPPAYYPNVIRATFDPLFPSGKGGGALGWYAEHSKEIKDMEPTDIPTKFSSDKNYSPAIASLVELLKTDKSLVYNETETAEIMLENLVRNSVVVGQYTSPKEEEYTQVDTPNIRKVNQRMAIHWVLYRFCEIYRRMQTICDMLNKDDILRKAYFSISEAIEAEGQHEDDEDEDQDEAASAPPSEKRARHEGHLDISVHRGGRRVIEVNL